MKFLKSLLATAAVIATTTGAMASIDLDGDGCSKASLSKPWVPEMSLDWAQKLESLTKIGDMSPDLEKALEGFREAIAEIGGGCFYGPLAESNSEGTSSEING